MNLLTLSSLNARTPSLLLLIPAYNEEARIGPVLEAYAKYFLNLTTVSVRIVVVLNGCRDKTLQVVQAAEQRFPSISHTEFPAAIGKGGALIEGLRLASMADLIGYVDADGATSPKAFVELVRELNNPGIDCAIGSRWIPGSVIRHLQTGQRRFASRLFHVFVEAFFGMGIRDTQCGAKVARRAAIIRIHKQLSLADLAFDVNFLYSLKRAGSTIIEVPTEWTDQSGSKVVFNLRTCLNMLLSLIRLRLIYSPFYRWMKPLRPLETWLYTSLHAPLPIHHKDQDKDRS